MGHNLANNTTATTTHSSGSFWGGSWKPYDLYPHFLSWLPDGPPFVVRGSFFGETIESTLTYFTFVIYLQGPDFEGLGFSFNMAFLDFHPLTVFCKCPQAWHCSVCVLKLQSRLSTCGPGSS